MTLPLGGCEQIVNGYRQSGEIQSVSDGLNINLAKLIQIAFPVVKSYGII